ncbi:DUF2793 domain-containing protein [Rhizobium sp. BK376]|uniref:DUF2793 domain-containing protein n=1 Tax=Rhizobium sp. BK376 TaxID=2512149 RepID=UPI00104E4EA7|nr:DUF2793 domain-containing protein [Rhizobium sp. BK376]TCR91853.1 uncharacterized protein DUF2793 [Rhizobium sp. BK376]
MSEETVNLALPYILPSQAQKHVTHNEALQRLDAVVQLVISAELSAPPDAPVEGDCYLIAAASTGPWSGKSGSIAFRQDGAWILIEPREGWQAWFLSEAQLRVLTGGAWTEINPPSSDSMPKLGINATADETNRLAVASPASLFSHVGNGHQIKINKAAPADTASLLFQTAWSGRAEMGLAGNDDFAIKVSPDGSAWQTGLAISPQGVVTTPGKPLVRASPPSGTSSPASGSQTGFGDPGIVQGGFSLGDAVGSGGGHSLVVPASGIYLLLLSASVVSSGGHSISLLANGSVTLAMVTSPALSGPERQTAAGLAFLTAGDGLTLLYSGTAQVEFGNGKTEIVALLL